MSSPSPDTWLTAILSEDAMTFEDAYWGERPPVPDAIPLILEALKASPNPLNRGKLIELLGECGDLSVLPVLEAELKSGEPSVQEWASLSISALRQGEPWQRRAQGQE